jgi:hypothetical protein
MVDTPCLRVNLNGLFGHVAQTWRIGALVHWCIGALVHWFLDT